MRRPAAIIAMLTAAASMTAALATVFPASADNGTNDGTPLSSWTKPVSDNLSEPFPGVQSQALNSKMFRIPGLLTLHNGWVLASADVRWGTTADSPANIDAAVSLSKDGGKTWTLSMTDHFVDVKDATTDWNGVDWPTRPSSKADRNASFIDPSILQTADGTIFRIIDAMPAYVGNFNPSQVGKESTGLDAKGNMLIAKGIADQPGSTKASDYVYYIDDSSVFDATVNGRKQRLRPIRAIDGNAEQQVWVDAEYNLYTRSGDAYAPQMTKQYATATAKSDVDIQNNVFYSQAEWKVYPTSYIWMRTADVAADGLTWSEPRVLNGIKTTPQEGFLGTGVGLGTTVVKADGTERLLFPVYNNLGNVMRASVIYSDDHGATWHRGSSVPGSSTSESEIVRMPDGRLRMYSRNVSNYVASQVSSDYGQTWTSSAQDKQLQTGSNDKVSFINVKGTLTDTAGKTWGNLVMGSYTVSVKRVGGIVRIGSMADNGDVTWLNNNDIRYPITESFSYSSLAQIDGNTIGLLREVTPDAGRILYDTFTITELLDKSGKTGWTYTADTSELDAAIARIDAEGLDEADYTAASWKPFAAALANARKVSGRTGATTGEVSDALSGLLDAREALVRRADNAELTALIGRIEAEISAGKLAESTYTPAAWRSLEIALANAKEVAADADVTTDQIGEAYAQLEQRRKELDDYLRPTAAEGKALLDEIANVTGGNAPVESKYTEKSWAAFQAALKNAQMIAYHSDSPTKAEVTEATERLAAATKALVERDNGGAGNGGDNGGTGDNGTGGDNGAGGNSGNGGTGGGDNGGGDTGTDTKPDDQQPDPGKKPGKDPAKNPSKPDGDGGLADTGSTAGMIALIAAGLIAAAGVSVALRRRA